MNISRRRVLTGAGAAALAAAMRSSVSAQPKVFTLEPAPNGKALKDPAVMDWVLGLLYEEIMPAIAYQVPDVARFARQTLERFGNPFLQHRLADIAQYHQDKVKVRLQSTAEEYERLFGKKPRRLLEAIQG